MKIFKILALVGVFLDMLLTHLGISKFGINYEANIIIRYIYSNRLWDWFFVFALAYFSTIYFILDILESVIKKFPTISLIIKFLAFLVILIPYVGFLGWVYVFLF